jgi:hypothetical protein
VGEVDFMGLANRGREVVRGGGGEMAFLDLWMGLWLSLDGAEMAFLDLWKDRTVVHSAAATAAAHSVVVAPAHDTHLSLLFLAGQRIYTACRCDADISEMPRFERRPVRVGGATGQLWRPTTYR